MSAPEAQRIVISGVGGQGVLFVTRLLAEAAILGERPVFTSETHGMAQRGGTVISHLKVGPFAGPLIRPGAADGLLSLKAENLRAHGGYLKSGGWTAVNSPDPAAPDGIDGSIHAVDADRVALRIGNPKSVNLILLGFCLARLHGRLFCTLEEVTAALENHLKDRPSLLDSAMRAIRAGAEKAHEDSLHL